MSRKPVRSSNQTEHGPALADAIRSRSKPDSATEVMPGVYLYHRISTAGSTHGIVGPSLCVIAQGSKEVLLGDEQFKYDTDNYLLLSMQLPLVSRIVEATRERPYLAFRLVLDPTVIAAVMVEAGEVARRGGDSVRGLAVSAMDEDLSNAVLRLVRLLDAPLEYRMLSPLIKREIVFRLLMGEQGARLRQAAVIGGQTHRIADAVEQVRNDFAQPLCIEDLARRLGMSVSGFHHHFKAVTAMSPLQFQKQVRLQEARRLMLSDGLDAASAGFKVGYDNPSHFSREYKRQFGEPPMRDVERLRDLAGAGSR